jgi:NIMA (never in mitosis gene a)-related kinase
MINEYLIQKKLGIGSYGTVYLVTKKNTNDFYVIKQISLFGLTPDEIKDVNLEAKILSSINSKYVVKYYDSFEEKNFLNIVMEYCDGGDLGQFIEEKKALNEPIKEDLIWNFFIKITLGLAAMHKSKILHRDLKALNIFMTKDLDVKIGDLGVSKMLNHSGSFAKTLIGTPYYLSPELCEEKPYNDKSDVWALGCILYELCTFRHPFNAKSQAALIIKILKGTHDPIGNNYSNDLKNLVNSLFEKDAKKRPSCKQILNNNIIIEKAKQFGLFHMFTELYPDFYNNIKNSSTFKNNKLIYCKNRYPRNYKMKNAIQKNNSIGNINIKNIGSNNLDISNKIIKKNNRIRHKSQFNSISTDSHSHNSIKNIFCRNNEKEIQLYNAKNLKNDFNNYNNVNEITDFNINAKNNNNNSNNNINNNNNNDIIMVENINDNNNNSNEENIWEDYLDDIFIDDFFFNYYYQRNKIQIKSIKKNLSKIKYKQNPNMEERCPICIEDFKNRQTVYNLPCSHIFHVRCLNKELKNRQRCPMCRKELTKKTDSFH